MTMSELDRIADALKAAGSSGEALVKRLSGATELEESGTGPWVEGADGGRYLDCGSFSLFLFGHNNQRFIQALTTQLRNHSGATRVLLHRKLPQALQALVSIMPSHIEKASLFNSGAEAVEAAIKLARMRRKRSLVAHFEGSYHGKTAGALSITDSDRFKSDHHPTLQDVLRVSRRCGERAAADIRRYKPAAVFWEPIQGEGGIYPFEQSFAQHVVDACRKVDTLIVCDEIQSGLGRTGDRWAFERLNIKPDVVLVGKSLGGGIIPVSAVCATRDAFQPFDCNPVFHSSTYAGNPMACAAVITAVEILKSPGFLRRLRLISPYLRKRLDVLSRRFPQLFQGVSGYGLMLGLHFREQHQAALFLNRCLQSHLILTPCLSCPTVLRIMPPAELSHREIVFLENTLVRVAHSLTNQNPVSKKELVADAQCAHR